MDTNQNIDLQLEGEAIVTKYSNDRQFRGTGTSETFINTQNSSLPHKTDPTSMNSTSQKWKKLDRDSVAYKQQRSQREQYLMNNASTSIHDQEELIQDIMNKSNGFPANKLGESRERRVNFTRVMHDFQ